MNTNLKVGDKVRVMRKNDSGKWLEHLKGFCMGFAYTKDIAEPTWCLFWDLEDLKEGSEYKELMPINSIRLRIVRY